MYRPFHKTLSRSSAYINWISVRFYETILELLARNMNVSLIFKKSVTVKYDAKFVVKIVGIVSTIQHTNASSLLIWGGRKKNRLFMGIKKGKIIFSSLVNTYFARTCTSFNGRRVGRHTLQPPPPDREHVP